MNKEESFLLNRIKDLANTAFNKNIYTYSDFLNINELSLLNHTVKELPPVKTTLMGGNNYAERKTVVFAPDEIYYKMDIPISVLKIAPVNSKFADTLCHRDFLGAILNLGINRCKIGDIFVKENMAYVYVKSEIADYIIENLFKIKHTNVSITVSEYTDIEVLPNFKEITGTISNVRLDSIIATALNSTRSSILSYIEERKVFINGKLTVSNGAGVKNGDIISVRGKGRFIFDGVIKETKKGRNLIKLRLYQ